MDKFTWQQLGDAAAVLTLIAACVIGWLKARPRRYRPSARFDAGRRSYRR